MLTAEVIGNNLYELINSCDKILNINKNTIIKINFSEVGLELISLGIEVYHQSTVGDNKQRLLECFDESLKRSDFVITTGGLGPT
ncbi:molybdopterin-binding protein, partial [Clostridioides difficile]